MGSKQIAAGIVLFNPDNLQRVEECINNVTKQVDRVYIFDNSTQRSTFDLPDNVVYLSENRNLGIATALNRIMEQAKKDGCKWLVTMDQDSIIPDGLIESYENKIGCTENLGIVCPQVIDNRRAYMDVIKEPAQQFVEFCITSASCTSVECWEKIGGFDEWLFIDLVDNDFCRRLILSGYRILRLNKFVLNQEFGKIVPKRRKSQLFWIKLSKVLRNNNIAKFSYKKYVSPMRVYYTCRNIIYINKKLGKYGKVAYQDNYGCDGYIGFLISFAVPSLLRAQEKGRVLKAILTGTLAGIQTRVNPWIASREGMKYE